jgi:hypothetical protein
MNHALTYRRDKDKTIKHKISRPAIPLQELGQVIQTCMNRPSAIKDKKKDQKKHQLTREHLRLPQRNSEQEPETGRTVRKEREPRLDQPPHAPAHARLMRRRGHGCREVVMMATTAAARGPRENGAQRRCRAVLLPRARGWT